LAMALTAPAANTPDITTALIVLIMARERLNGIKAG